MITEIYVPRESFVVFMEEARQTLREHQANLIYGTVRLVEKDDESFLAWARQPYACIVFNLHVTHDPVGIENAARAFRSLIASGASRISKMPADKGGAVTGKVWY